MGKTMLTPLIDILRCPRCGGRVDERKEALACNKCTQTYPIANGIPQLFIPNEWGESKLDVTDIVKDFYEEAPFPSYDDLDNRASLKAKAQRGIFARLLDQQIPPDALVLDVGCGTGQLTNFLGMESRRRVIGTDICMNSLRLGKGFRDRHAIVNAHFVQMNLFRPCFPNAGVDVVVSNGVLHHTADPEGGFRSIVAKLRPGGYIVIGLYNWLGRLPTLWRRRLIEMFGDRMAALDGRLRGNALNKGRWAAWFRDQYKHPHESKHSMGEALRWFGENEIEFMSCIPLIGGGQLRDNERIFDRHKPGTRLDRWMTEIEMLISGGTDGGLFVMIGRKVQ